MKKLIMILAGIMLIAMVFIALVFTGMIFDAGKKFYTRTYFFQVNSAPYQRPGAPLSAAEIGDRTVFDILLKKYVTEYFYVLPDMSDIQKRESYNSAFYIMSNRALKKTFEPWKNNIAPEITQMAEDGMLRTVSVIDIQPYGQYHQVEYQLKTWEHPNDMTEEPQITTGTMLIAVKYTPGVREKIITDLPTILKGGYDPSVVFDFKVMDVIH